MAKKILRIVLALVLVALTVGIVVYYFYDIKVNGTGWTENLLKTVAVVFSGVVALVRLFVGDAGRKSLGFYESHYSEQINNAFADSKRNRKKLLKAIRFYNENKLKKAANYLIDLKPVCNTTDEYRAVGLLLGLTFTDMEFYPEAINVYEQVIYMGLATDTMYSNLGHIYAKLGNSEQAMKHYEKALFINPENAYAYNNIAKIHFDKHSRYIKIVLAFAVLICVVLGLDTYVFATEDGFITEELSEDKQKLFLSNIDIYVITAEEQSKPISCFDVNSDGCIVLGFDVDDTGRKKVSVYDEDGVFKYGYSFECSGTFGVGWNGENISIYFVRSDIAATFNKNADCLEIRKIQNSIENNTYWNQEVFASIKSAGDKEYHLKNDMGFLNLFASAYSQLMVVDDGVENIIYNVNDSYFLKLMIKFVFVVIMISIVITSIIWECIRYKKSRVN